MEEYLSFVTIDTWSMIFTWGNLVILYLLMKKILFRPVSEILAKRDQEVHDLYADANSAKSEAQSMKSEYETRLSDAKSEADQLLRNATKAAQLQEEEILKKAQEKAQLMVRRAETQIDLEKRNAVNDVKDDLSDMAISLASRILENDLDEKKHHALIEDFIHSIGDAS